VPATAAAAAAAAAAAVFHFCGALLVFSLCRDEPLSPPSAHAMLSPVPPAAHLTWENSCTAGYYCLAASVNSTSIVCPAGHFCLDGSSLGTSNLCPAGFSCPLGTPSATSFACPAGTFATGGAAACSQCAAGRFGSTGLLSSAACRCVAGATQEMGCDVVRALGALVSVI
jgi:hypothetical protein